MQKTIIVCDECDKELNGKKHISLMLNTNNTECGLRLPNKPDPNISNQSIYNKIGIKRHHTHFCSGQCLGRYFSKLIKEAEADAKADARD